MSTAEVIAIFLSIISVIISFLTLFLQFKISYPSIKLERIAKTCKNSFISYVCCQDSLQAFVFIKFNIINFSPTKGCVCNCNLKYRFSKKLSALSSEEISLLPNNVVNAFNDFKKGDPLLELPFTTKPLSSKTVVAAFKLNSKYLEKKLKIFATYFADVKYTDKLKIIVPNTIYEKMVEVYCDEFIYVSSAP